MLKIGKPLDDMNLKELSEIKIAPFLTRLIIYLAIAGALGYAILHTHGVAMWLAMIGLGLMYGHAVELQHQALHNTALPSRGWNRFVGFFLGLPMLVSFSDYQFNHLNHHRLLGSKEDREFFNYGYEKLTSLRPLLLHLIMFSHYRDVTGFIARACLGQTKPNVKEESAVKIRTEYIWMAVFIVAALGVSIAFNTTAMVKLWLIPLLFAIPTHALIELPEHWGKDHDTLDVSQNTRTIHATWFGYWFSNGNNYHIEHHWLPGVPNDRFPGLHKRVLKEQEVETETYPQFYKKFFLELYRNTFSSSGTGLEKGGATT
jgi:fatty acid desaturase